MLIKLLLGAILFAVAFPVLLAAACGRSLLYHPTRLSPSQYDLLARQPGWQGDLLERADAPTLRGLVRPAEQGPWILFFGGNAMGLHAGQSILEMVAHDVPWGLALWAYRGYDGSQGSPTEEGLCSDALAEVDRLQSQYGVQPGRIVIMGQSLGSGIAARLAADLAERNAPPAALILLSPYISMAQVFDDQVPIIPVGWVAADPYRTDRILPEVQPPVLILHGTADTLIGIEHGRAVAEALGDRAQLVELEGRGHNDLWDDARAVFAIRELVGRVARGLDTTADAEPAE